MLHVRNVIAYDWVWKKGTSQNEHFVVSFADLVGEGLIMKWLKLCTRKEKLFYVHFINQVGEFKHRSL